MEQEKVTIKSLWDCDFVGKDKKSFIYPLKNYVKALAHECHHNAQRTVMYLSKEGYDIHYCEGYICGTLGHCFNRIGNEYFDIRLKKGETEEAILVLDWEAKETIDRVYKNRCWTFMKVFQYVPKQ